MTVDTLAIARELRAADLPDQQTEAIAAAIGRSAADVAAVKSDVDTFVARLDAFEGRLSGKIEALDQTLNARFSALDERLSGKINALDQTLNARLGVLDDRLSGKIESSKAALLTWLVGVVIAVAGLLFAAQRLL